MSEAQAGRPNQKMRTRKQLLRAASELMASGRTPTLEEIAEAALVSRATAYRYFPNVEALLVEAALDIAMPDQAQLFADGAGVDPVSCVQRADTAMDDMIAGNEKALRLMMVHALQRSLYSGDPEPPLRQNRRSALIDAALAPARKDFKPNDLAMLRKALALVIGTESMLVFKDVLRIDDAEARRVKRWAIKALVEAAKK
jgi:AcrR family transcriptional regulator